MSKVFLPELASDGIGGAILPATVTGNGDPAFMLMLRDNPRGTALQRRALSLFEHDGGRVAQEIPAAGFRVSVFQPGWFPSRSTWAALGVREYRLKLARASISPDDRDKVRWRFDDACETLGINPSVFQPDILGLNRFGEEVRVGPLGRSLTRKGVVHGEWELAPDGRQKRRVSADAFLRGDTRRDFSLSARGIALMIAKGEKFSRSRITDMWSAITEDVPDFRDRAGFRLIDLQEDIEGHLSDLVVRASVRSASPRDVVTGIDDAMATHADRNGTRVTLQQYSTPFPLGRVGVETIMPQPGERLLEPTVGNGVLVSGFRGRGLDITGIELDPARYSRVQSVMSGEHEHIVQGDYLEWSANQGKGETFRLIVANPPFGKLPTPVTKLDAFDRRMTLRTLHHDIVFDALSKLDKQGRAFLVVPGAMMREGTIEGADRYFDNWLRSTHHVAGSASIDGRLYRKMGTEYPVVLYAVGPRRDVPLNAEEIGANMADDHRIILSHDELFAWADQTQERMKELTGLEFVDYADLKADKAPRPIPRPAPPASAEPQPEPAAPEPRPAPVAPAEQAPTAETAPEPSDTGVGERASGGRRERTKRVSSPSDEPVKTGAPPVRGYRKPEDTPVAKPQEVVAQAPEPVAPVVAPSRPTPPSEVALVDDLEEDPFVRRYQSFSTVGEPTTQIQKSLQGLTYRALLDVESKHGPIDEYVAGKLGLTPDDLEGRVSPEQIDALGLNFARHEEGRGFLIADLMGVGKGRFIAANMMAAMAEDRPIIFMTEQPNLFTDMLMRDLRDVTKQDTTALLDEGKLRPFIFNNGPKAKIIDPVTQETVVRPGKWEKSNDRTVAVGISDANIVLSTYSQFQSANGPMKMSALLSWVLEQTDQGKPPLLVLDEAHRAAGETSKTGEQIERLVDSISRARGPITYSSATPLKSGRNIKIFGPILPDIGMNTNTLIDLIERNPLALQEVLSSEMGRLGTMISREVDSRGIRRDFISLQEINPERYDRLVKSVDMAAEFLSELVEKAVEIKTDAKRMADVMKTSNDEGVSVTTTSPVSQFHAYSQYLMVALKTAFADEMITQAIAQGKKPVIAVENTGADMLSRLANRIGEPVPTGGLHIDRLPDVGDVLTENAAKMLTVKFTDTFGNQSEKQMEQYEGWLQRFVQRVEDARLDGIGELTIAPLDRLREIAQERDLVFGELTGRGIQAEKSPDGGYIVSTRQPEPVQSVIRKFNNGDIDVVALNRVAASGVSMHPSPSTGEDLRPRVMLKLQLQSEVTFERQIDGRINRYGQVHPAEYQIPMSGFPADDRLAQLFNRKNRSLSSTSTATRENATNIEDTVDLLNPVGEATVRKYLSDNIELCLRLNLSIPGDGDDRDTGSYGRKVMGRLVLLPVAEARSVLSEIDTAYRMKIEALDAAGQNPLRLNQFDWKAKAEVVEELAAGDAKSEEMGKRPVQLVKLTYSEEVEAIKSDDLASLVERGQETAARASGGVPMTAREIIGDLFNPDTGLPDLSNPAYDRAMKRTRADEMAGIKPVSEEDALSIYRRLEVLEGPTFDALESHEKGLVRAFQYAEFLDCQLDQLNPGTVVGVPRDIFPDVIDGSSLSAKLNELNDAEGNEVIGGLPGVVTRLTLDPEDPLLLGRWKVSLAVPGRQHVEEVSLASIYARRMAREAEAPLNTVPHSVFKINPNMRELFRRAAFDKLPPSMEQIAHAEYGEDRGWFQYTRKPWKEYIDATFNAAPSGLVKRHAFALEGNMFLAMHLSTMGTGGGRLGQKAIYTSANGEIRHGVILKKGEDIAKITAQLSRRLDGLSTPMKWTHPALVGAAMRSYNSAWAVERVDAGYKRSGRVNPEAMKDMVSDLTLLMSNGNKTEGVRDYVVNNLTEIVNSMRQAMSGKSVPEIFIGSDLFSEAEEAYKSYSSKLAAHIDRHNSYIDLSEIHDRRALTALAGGVSGNDVHVLMWENENCLLYSRKGKAVVSAAEAAGIPDFLSESKNTLFPTGTKIRAGGLAWRRAGPLGYAAESVQKVADVLCSVAESENLSIQTRGPVAKAFAVIEAHSKKALELAAEKALEAASEKASEQSTEECDLSASNELSAP